MNIVILGPPGSGKGTQAKILAEKLGLYYFEAGEFSRELAKKDEEIRKFVDKGDLIPEHLMTRYVSQYLNDRVSNWKNIIFDGFPRFIKQYDYLKSLLAANGSKIDAVIFLEVDEKEIVKRLSARRIDRNTGAIYNLITNPQPLGINPDSLYQRSDDKPDVIRQRIREFKENTTPLIEKVGREGNLIKIAGGKSIKEVTQSIFKSLGLNNGKDWNKN